MVNLHSWLLYNRMEDFVTVMDTQKFLKDQTYLYCRNATFAFSMKYDA